MFTTLQNSPLFLALEHLSILLTLKNEVEKQANTIRNTINRRADFSIPTITAIIVMNRAPKAHQRTRMTLLLFRAAKNIRTHYYGLS